MIAFLYTSFNPYQKGEMKRAIIFIACLLLLSSPGATLAAADLTGNWDSMNYSCKNKSKGIKCKAKGRLLVQNIGDTDVKTSFVRFYVSDDGLFGGEERFLKRVASGKVKAGKSKAKTLSYSFAYGETLDCKYILAVIDAENTIAETDEKNNTVSYGPFSCTLGSIQGNVTDVETLNPIQNADRYREPHNRQRLTFKGIIRYRMCRQEL